MQTITLKFGGSSLASAAQFRKVAEIVHADPARRFVVASAPGKRDSKDTKVTDLLYRCYDLAVAQQSYLPVLEQIEKRFQDIITELGISFNLEGEIAIIREHLMQKPRRDYMASRGEYLNSKILAAYLQYPFVDPADYILFREDGSYDAEVTSQRLGEALRPMNTAVVAGFYGAMADGTVRTFSRGGSDVTGAIVAEAVHADLYENWTDVSGMLAASPVIVENPRVIDFISYQELRELSYMGATVLHEDAVFPVRKAGIPINIRNTNRPQDPGTMIEATLPRNRRHRVVTGIAGHTGFSSIQVEKSMMNGEIGFVARLLQIIADFGISIEHCPSGIDTMSVFLHTENLKPHKEEILQRIRAELQPDTLIVEDHLALLAVVGEGMPYSKGVAARIFRALANAGVNVRMIDQGSSELNIIIGVDEEDYEAAIRGIYDAVMD